MKKRLGVLFLFLSLKAWTAPYPVTSSSLFLDNKINPFLWPFKIELNLKNTPFELDLSQEDSEKWVIKSRDSGVLIYVRFKSLAPKEDYDKSLRSWIREYEKSGYQIVARSIPQKDADKGWLHLQDSQAKQLLQYFKYKDKTWAYLNCVGSREKLVVIRQNCEYLHSLLVLK